MTTKEEKNDIFQQHTELYLCVFVSQAAGVIHRALCLLVPERRDPGATLEAGSATANLV